MERLYHFEHARRRRMERGALAQRFGRFDVQHLFTEASSAIDAAAHLCAGVACRSSGCGILLELAALLVYHEHLFRQVSVLIAFGPDESLDHGFEVSGGCAPAALLLKNLVEDKLVRDRPQFERIVSAADHGSAK